MGVAVTLWKGCLRGSICWREFGYANNTEEVIPYPEGTQSQRPKAGWTELFKEQQKGQQGQTERESETKCRK